jgi:exodeoxyribonuclease-3
MAKGKEKKSGKAVRMISWNVNGLRALLKKGFLDWVRKERPHILCLQETKASPDQLPEEVTAMAGYEVYFSSAEKKGYSGVATFCRDKPVSVKAGFGIRKFDSEGRILITDHGDFLLYNIYFPNGKASRERLEYKMAFYDAFLDHAQRQRRKGRHIVVCGDVNTAHREIDLARPRENENVSGFLPRERAWIDRLIESGYVDTFRMFNKEPGRYTWWDLKSRARDRNVGWRIDYFFVSRGFAASVKAAFIMAHVTGSDHCPIGMDAAAGT